MYTSYHRARGCAQATTCSVKFEDPKLLAAVRTPLGGFLPTRSAALPRRRTSSTSTRRRQCRASSSRAATGDLAMSAPCLRGQQISPVGRRPSRARRARPIKSIRRCAIAGPSGVVDRQHDPRPTIRPPVSASPPPSSTTKRNTWPMIFHAVSDRSRRPTRIITRVILPGAEDVPPTQNSRLRPRASPWGGPRGVFVAKRPLRKCVGGDRRRRRRACSGSRVSSPRSRSASRRVARRV